MELNPESINKEEGLRLLKAGEVDEAIKILAEIAKHQPNDAQLQTYLGAAYNQKGDKLHAIRAFERAAEIEETPKSFYNLGLIYEGQHRIDEAVRQYKLAVQKDPDYTPAQQALDKLHNQYLAAHPEQQPQQTPEPAAATAVQQGNVTVQPPPPQPGVTIQGGPPPGEMHPLDNLMTPQVGPPPTAQDHAAREYEKAMKAKEDHKKLMKSGLTYGIICGSIFLTLCYLAAAFLLFMLPSNMAVALLIVAAVGGIYGGIIGLWIAYTCGGDTAGMHAGAVMGLVLGLVMGLIWHLVAGQIVMTMIMFAVISGAMGMMLGRMVEASIQ